MAGGRHSRGLFSLWYTTLAVSQERSYVEIMPGGAVFVLEGAIVTRSPLASLVMHLFATGCLPRAQHVRLFEFTCMSYVSAPAGSLSPGNRARALRLLASVPRTVVSAAIGPWASSFVSRTARSSALRAIGDARADGMSILLLSSDPAIVVGAVTAAVARHPSQPDDDADVPAATAVDFVAGATDGWARAHAADDWLRVRGLDACDSIGYAAAIGDTPLLNYVGRPVVLGGDRPLRRVARARDWALIRT